jgi:tetratricopeptide (TPR) repeat protein
MCVRINEFGACVGRSFTWVGQRVRVAVIAAGVSATALPCAALADDSAEESEPVAAAEDSVLVATREAKVKPASGETVAKDVAKDDELQPISQVSEHAPELAELASAETEAKSTEKETDKESDSFSSALAGVQKKPKVEAQPAKFNGVQPGVSTEKDVIAAWKEPAETTVTDDGKCLTYHIEPFKSVEVEFEGAKVSAINIELQGGLPPKRLAKQLSLDALDEVAVTDAEGATLGQVYPERGVLFLFAPPSDVVAATTNMIPPTVTHVVIQPLDATAFALRAESRLHGPYEKNIKDLNTALTLDTEFAQAHWLLADIYLATGQIDKAMDAAEEACELDPENAAYLLRKAQVASALSNYDDATLGVRSVLDNESTPPIVKAQALHEMAQLAALGDAEIAGKTISFENKAIALADTLATSKNTKERRAAKQLLVEAHLSVARQIAGQSFDNQLDSVSQWVGRASGLAEDLIAHDGGSVELRLMVAKESLAALASLKPTKDPSAWVSEAEESAKTLSEQCSDDLWSRRVQWELGQVYFHAVRIEHLRLQPAAALRYGQLAIENLADGASKRQSVYDSEQLVGKLYFHIGVVHAVQKQDHKTAAEWYDKAMPLLAAPRPVSELLAPQHDGEEFVSMGVTYWQIGEKDHAIDLTLNGADLIERAVDAGVLQKKALAVPYGNLAAMYEQLGSKEDSAKYSELARTAGGLPKPVVASNRSASNRRAQSTMTIGQRRPNMPSNGQRQMAGRQPSRQPMQRTAQQPNSSNRTR